MKTPAGGKISAKKPTGCSVKSVAAPKGSKMMWNSDAFRLT